MIVATIVANITFQWGHNRGQHHFPVRPTAHQTVNGALHAVIEFKRIIDLLGWKPKNRFIGNKILCLFNRKDACFKIPLSGIEEEAEKGVSCCNSNGNIYYSMTAGPLSKDTEGEHKIIYGNISRSNRKIYKGTRKEHTHKTTTTTTMAAVATTTCNKRSFFFVFHFILHSHWDSQIHL